MANNNMEGLDDETLQRLRPLVIINYVRVNNVIDDHRIKIAYEPGLYGTVMVTDCWGCDIVYHRYNKVYRERLRLGNPLELKGPMRAISGQDTVIFTVNFWGSSWFLNGTEISKEIARGEIVWDPKQSLSSSYDKPLQGDVLGKYGSASVGYSVMTEALSATINVVWMKDSEAEIYGTIKAIRIFRGSPTTLILFNKKAVDSAHVSLHESIFNPVYYDRGRSVPFPVPGHSYLTIEVDLWDQLSSDSQVVLGSVIFAPKLGTQKKNITGKLGEVQVSLTCD